MGVLPSIVILLSLLCSIHVVMANFDPAQALEYAYACAVSNCPPEKIKAWNCGAACHNLTGYQYYYAEQINISSDETLEFAMVLNPTSQKFITIFRGTAGTPELLMEILQGNDVPYKLSNITDGKADEFFYNHYVNNLRPLVIPKLQMAYATYPGYQYVFTGHSLGGALTTLCCFDVISQGLIPREKVIMYNYGSPRVVNQVLAQAIEAAIPVIYRVVHWKDIVPHVPPCQIGVDLRCTPKMVPQGYFWPAWHVATEVFYNADQTNYTICQGGEDPACADQFNFLETSFAEHDYYMNMHMGCDPESSIETLSSQDLASIEELINLDLINDNEAFPDLVENMKQRLIFRRGL